MATKAELFRYETERSRPKRAPAPARKAKRRRTDDAGAKNFSARAEKHAQVATEESHSGKPSRKASRPSHNHGKNNTVLEYTARMRSASPQTRYRKR